MRLGPVGMVAVLVAASTVLAGPTRTPRIRTVTGRTFSAAYVRGTFSRPSFSKGKKLTVAQMVEDIPFDNAPAREILTLRTPWPKGWKRADLPPYPAMIQLIPLADRTVPDYAKAYPVVKEHADALRALLEKGLGPVAPMAMLPDWNCVDADQTVHAKLELVETPAFRGVQYVTQYVAGPGEPIANPNLLYKFQGLSRDGRWYLAVEIPLLHTSFPHQSQNLPYIQPEAKAIEHYQDMEAMLNLLDDTSFVPSLAAVWRMVQSVRPVRLQR